MLHCFQLHFESESSFAGQDIFALEVGIHHQDDGGIVVEFSDDDRHGFQTSQLSGVASAMTG